LKILEIARALSQTVLIFNVPWYKHETFCILSRLRVQWTPSYIFGYLQYWVGLIYLLLDTGMGSRWTWLV